MSAVLLDTHALIWFANGDPISRVALDAIDSAPRADAIYVSPISAWEASLASRKRTSPANLGGLTPSDWFREILGIPGVRLTGISRRVALEAASVPPIYGQRRPRRLFPDRDGEVETCRSGDAGRRHHCTVKNEPALPASHPLLTPLARRAEAPVKQAGRHTRSAVRAARSASGANLRRRRALSFADPLYIHSGGAL
jgi:PIN domain nuclease of toxin-antitoxin system